MEKVEHQDPTEQDENIIKNKEEVNETSVDGDNVGDNPEVVKTNNKEAANMAESGNLEKCANEM